mmetsp:Transcript_89128/g.251552  ORF Transcript_89128/g.251552 Transcript_89128/m.251552 type:complete len:112 (+) Transcript_89128:1-336(+)
MVMAELLFPVQTQMERAKFFDCLHAGRLPVGANAIYPEALDLLLQMVSFDPRERPSAEDLSAFLHNQAHEHQHPLLAEPRAYPKPFPTPRASSQMKSSYEVPSDLAYIAVA